MKSVIRSIIISFVLTMAVSAQPKPVAFTHVTVIDATGKPPMADMTIIVKNNRIALIGKSRLVKIPNEAQIIEAEGKFLIPGLWDMHIHSGGYENGRKYLPRLVAQGITGVRDMGTALDDILKLRQEVGERKIIGPRMIIAGPIVQGPLPFKMPVFVSVNNQAKARQTVISLHRSGVDFIKVQDALPRDLYFAIADEAKRQGMALAGHVPPSVSAVEASNTGQYSIIKNLEFYF